MGGKWSAVVRPCKVPPFPFYARSRDIDSASPNLPTATNLSLALYRMQGTSSTYFRASGEIAPAIRHPKLQNHAGACKHRTRFIKSLRGIWSQAQLNVAIERHNNDP